MAARQILLLLAFVTLVRGTQLLQYKTATRGNSPGVSQPPFLDLLSPSCQACFRSADVPVHRSVLAVGITSAVQALHDFDYHVHYINFDDTVAKTLFDGGYPSLLWQRQLFDTLPFSDLSIDVVLVNNTAFDGPDLSAVLHEASRILSPAGSLAFAFPFEAGALSFPGLHGSKVLRQGRFSNFFERIDGMVAGVPVCEKCGMGSFHDMSNVRPAAELHDGSCQPYIPSSYVSVNDTKRKERILTSKSLSLGRVRHWPTSNVLNTTMAAPSWTDNAYHKDRRWFEWNYVKKSEVIKTEWKHKFFEMIQSGQVKRVLDAGAGSCTLDSVLREAEVFDLLRPFMAFGAYDCSMLRICGERGATSFDYDWRNPLPFCKDCKFDLIFQAEGIHHVKPEDWTQTFDSFDKHLSCDGFLFMAGGKECGNATSCWRDAAKNWATAKGYTWEGNQKVLIKAQKTC